jgi:hypothetical protein
MRDFFILSPPVQGQKAMSYLSDMFHKRREKKRKYEKVCSVEIIENVKMPLGNPLTST